VQAGTDAPIERDSLQPGEIRCVRTNDHRPALVTIVDASEQAVEFGATVWDPPIPREQRSQALRDVLPRG
jgi:hypothetical protein